MHKVQQCGGTFRDFCGPVWVKNKPISVPAIVKPFCTAIEKDISNIEKNPEIIFSHLMPQPVVVCHSQKTKIACSNRF